jgi:hypothetical protein
MTAALTLLFAVSGVAPAHAVSWAGRTCVSSLYVDSYGYFKGTVADKGYIYQTHSGTTHGSTGFGLSSTASFHSYGYGWYVVSSSSSNVTAANSTGLGTRCV